VPRFIANLKKTRKNSPGFLFVLSQSIA